MKRILNYALLVGLICVLFLGTVLIAACGDDDKNSGQPTGSETPTAISKETPAQTTNTPSPTAAKPVVYNIADSTGDWGFPSPYAHYSRGPGYIRMQFIFETLVWKNETEFVPQLAKEWQYVAEDNAYIFKLQTGVKWHDGTAFTAEDVAFTFDYAKQHPYQWVDNSIVKSVEALDTYTVKLYLNKPYAPFLNDVAGVQPIMPKHIWQNVNEPEKFTSPEAAIGTGPYLFADYNKEMGTYRYKANDNYYLGKPSVSEIRFVKIAAQMVPAALKDGSLNAGTVPAEVVDEMKSKNFTVIIGPPSWNAKLTINHQKSPLSSKELRQAIAYAIDREELVQITQRGHAIAGSPGMMPPTSVWYNPDTPKYGYNPEKAKQLIEGLGYTFEGGSFTKDGKELKLELICAADYKEMGQFIADQLEKAGIKIDLRTLEGKTVDAKVGAWDFDLSIYGHGGLFEPSFLTRSILGEGFNSARYSSDAKLTALLQNQTTEMNAAKRKNMVFQIQKLYAEDMPALTLYYPTGDYWAHDGTADAFFTMDGVAIGVPIALNRMCFVK